MGRLIGIPYFSSDAAFVEEKSDASTVRRSKGIDPDAPIDQASVNCLVLIARRMQRQFEGRVLRRTIDSLDWRGQRVIDIPPFEEITVVLKLTTREMDIISELADSVKERSVLLLCSRKYADTHSVYRPQMLSFKSCHAASTSNTG